MTTIHTDQLCQELQKTQNYTLRLELCDHLDHQSVYSVTTNPVPTTLYNDHHTYRPTMSRDTKNSDNTVKRLRTTLKRLEVNMTTYTKSPNIGGPPTQNQQLSIMTTIHTDQLCQELQRTLIILSRVSELHLETRGKCAHPDHQSV